MKNNNSLEYLKLAVTKEYIKNRLNILRLWKNYKVHLVLYRKNEIKEEKILVFEQIADFFSTLHRMGLLTLRNSRGNIEADFRMFLYTSIAKDLGLTLAEVQQLMDHVSERLLSTSSPKRKPSFWAIDEVGFHLNKQRE